MVSNIARIRIKRGLAEPTLRSKQCFIDAKRPFVIYKSRMNYRFASPKDAPVLAPLNQELIRDEGHRNPMTLAQLNERLVGWLASDYRAVIFEDGPLVVGYALFRHEPEYVYLRQLFVLPSHRRKGIGRAALQWLWANAWVGVERLRIEVLTRAPPHRVCAFR